MIRELLNSVEYGWIASTALVLFFSVFLAVTIRTLLTDKKTIDSQADIPLTDGQRRNT
ncbi:hypothetical protein Pan97_38500 [Bremerella volcania]|uniref:Cbb3-type cytochrome oxidase component FixQ n=1 Tax=Bremerella volcania TaxID=2527984 RepID=A0A518CC43_9BACT|nr:hypothetical protein [Bremerella volcania]QDU76793.1 hypothetical protein Pan97_38500 [Bremerella volcania]